MLVNETRYQHRSHRRVSFLAADHINETGGREARRVEESQSEPQCSRYLDGTISAYRLFGCHCHPVGNLHARSFMRLLGRSLLLLLLIGRVEIDPGLPGFGLFYIYRLVR